MPNLYRNESSDPKSNAQRNLSGRTHYVDDDTLRFHKSRVISARHTDGGLLFAIVTSDAKDYENRSRGFRFVVFDLFGAVIDRKIDAWFRTSEQATKAMWAAVNALDAVQITRAGIEREARNHKMEMERVESDIARLIAEDKARTMVAAIESELASPAEHLAGIRDTLGGIK
jgi:hypothetical protein